MVRGLKLAVVVALLASAAQAEVSSAVRQEDRPLRGLTQPAEMIIDRWGIPHIYAASARDAFFLQGYNAARDRLWQIDLWRKRGLGRLSAPGVSLPRTPGAAFRRHLHARRSARTVRDATLKQVDQLEGIDVSLGCPTLGELFAKNLAEPRQLKRLSLASPSRKRRCPSARLNGTAA